MDDPPPPAGGVEVHVPAYRPNSFVPVLGWLAGRLAAGGAIVTWRPASRQGPEPLHRLLAASGWEVAKEGKGRQARLVGAAPPVSGPPPAARTFTADLGGVLTDLAADFGVFSPGRVDDGTALLLDVALRHPRVDAVADVGIGYGPLAVALVRGGVAASAFGTDVDSVALWLAAANARRHGVPLRLACTPDPAGVPPTGLTVCNIPTHVNAADTARLTAGLRARAGHGTLLAVVHASLADRYARHLDATGRRLRRHPGPAHVVLELPG
jgi:16S rRNA (guanine1207-N2)-methyltransferase